MLLGSSCLARPIAAVQVDERTLQSCDNLHQCRSLWNIIWSCLATIFSCIWVAAHPNIPGPQESSFTVTLRRVKLVVLALLVPEFVIAWAIRQRIVAHKVAKAQQGHGWTRIHGFFVGMGGFMLFDPDSNQFLYPLDPAMLTRLVDDGFINFPDITKEEIRDRSKGDILSKALVLLQTGWFLVQCLARAVEHLPVTELEIVTVAFATLNLMTYAFWWDKPLNVRRPFRVVLKKPMPHGGPKPKTITSNNIWDLVGIAIGEIDAETVLSAEERVPTFYAGDLDEEQRWLSGLAAMVIAIIFGGIHCIAWSFSFPTRTEQTLWHIASTAIIGVPAVCLAHFGYVYWFPDSMASVIAVLTLPISLFLYCFARIVLLVLPFTTLRSLSYASYQTVHWTTFIPHI